MEVNFHQPTLPRRLDLLLIIRGIAAILVIYWHLHGHIDRNNFLASFFIVPGRLSVWVFFMMSGYLIGYGLIHGRYEKSLKGMGKFYINRILRVYPLFIIVSFVALLVNQASFVIDFNFIIQQLFMLQWDHSYLLNGVFWTLGIEMHFYLIAPLLIFISMKLFTTSINWSIGLYCFAWLALYAYAESSLFNNWDIRNIIGSITQFLVGFICAHNKNQLTSLFFNKRLIVVLMIVIFTVYFNYNYDNYDMRNVFDGMKMIFASNIIGFGLILLHQVTEYRDISLNLFTKLLSILGVLSYGVYAWHGFLVINNIFIDNLILHTSLSILMAYFSYLFIEKQFLKLKR
jgi:peptidoglycan/LPS O-acetylase OafA/YrhL